MERMSFTIDTESTDERYDRYDIWLCTIAPQHLNATNDWRIGSRIW